MPRRWREAFIFYPKCCCWAAGHCGHQHDGCRLKSGHRRSIQKPCRIRWDCRLFPWSPNATAASKNWWIKLPNWPPARINYIPELPEVSADHLDIYQNILETIRPLFRNLTHPEWVAVKLMEGDPEVSAMVEKQAQQSGLGYNPELLSKHEDALHAVVNGRYDWIEKITRAAVSRFKMGQVVLTDRIDHVLTRPIFGIPILLAIMAFVFFLTYTVGVPLQNWHERRYSAIYPVLEPSLTGWPAWIQGLMLNGVIGGAGSVLTFLPILLIFFAIMALSGRCRLYGARRLCYGQDHASGRPAWQKFHSDVPGFRLQCPGCSGRAHYRDAQGPDDHAASDSFCPLHRETGRPDARFRSHLRHKRRLCFVEHSGLKHCRCWAWPEFLSTKPSGNRTHLSSWNCRFIISPISKRL